MEDDDVSENRAEEAATLPLRGSTEMLGSRSPLSPTLPTRITMTATALIPSSQLLDQSSEWSLILDGIPREVQ